MRPLILFSFLALRLHGATFYVATDGNDSWNGLAPAFVSGTTGPYATFQNWNTKTAAGDILYVRGGVYQSFNDSTWFTIRHTFTHVGTSANPIIISNYPGETPILFESGTNNHRIYLNGASWVNIYGITVSNAYRSVNYQNCQNCEFAYNTVTGRGNGVTDPGGTLDVQVYDSTQHCWFHHNLIKDAQHGYASDAGHGITFGLFYTLTDATAFNIIENNVCYWAGHDTMSVYGSSNLVRGNFMHNEAWYFRQDWNMLAGHRCMELGGQIGNFNVVESNRLQHAATHAGAHGIEVSSGVGQIIRFNELLNNDYSGLTLYGKGFPCNSNRVYNNTLFGNGFGPRYQTNYDANTNVTTVSDWAVWKYAVSLTSTTNNFFLNNIIWSNYLDQRIDIGGTVPGGYRWDNNLTTDPSFVDTNDAGPFSTNRPSVRLGNSGSAAIDYGTWLTTISSASGNGASVNVVDAGYFFAGLTAAGRTVSGDTIQLEGTKATAVITNISGNTLSLDRSITWTLNQGISLPFIGAAPDAGAYEYQNPRALITGGVTASGKVTTQ